MFASRHASAALSGSLSRFRWKRVRADRRSSWGAAQGYDRLCARFRVHNINVSPWTSVATTMLSAAPLEYGIDRKSCCSAISPYVPTPAAEGWQCADDSGDPIHPGDIWTRRRVSGEHSEGKEQIISSMNTRVICSTNDQGNATLRLVALAHQEVQLARLPSSCSTARRIQLDTERSSAAACSRT